MGQTAVEPLLRRIAAEFPPPERRVLGCWLVRRRSCGCAGPPTDAAAERRYEVASAAPSPDVRRPRGVWSSPMARQEALACYLCIAPWVLGFLIFTLGPMLASLYMGLTDWSMTRGPRWVGADNYVAIVTRDQVFWRALRNTAYYVLGHVPLQLALAFVVALLLNNPIRGVSIYRAVFYLPSVFSGVAVALMWSWIFNPNVGFINQALGLVSVRGPGWIFDEDWAMPSLILMSLWPLGGPMVIFLAGLQGIPTQLYEAAQVEGANWWQRLWHVTVPLMSPVLFFNLVISMIGSFQVFERAYVMTGGGPNYATMVYVLYLYQNAFQAFKMGYASALAWILFLIILALTVVQFRIGRRWVFYEGAGKR
jgi:multiple sugar transport system permease protein